MTFLVFKNSTFICKNCILQNLVFWMNAHHERMWKPPKESLELHWTDFQNCRKKLKHINKITKYTLHWLEKTKNNFGIYMDGIFTFAVMKNFINNRLVLYYENISMNKPIVFFHTLFLKIFIFYRYNCRLFSLLQYY